MENLSTNPMSATEALNITKTKPNDQVPPAVPFKLERRVAAIWRKIQTHPNSYMMTKDEYAVFTYATRFERDPMAQLAVARFESHHQGDLAMLDSAGLSSTSSEVVPPSSRVEPAPL